MDMFSRFEEFMSVWNTCTVEERDRIRTFVLNGEMPETSPDRIQDHACRVLEFLNEKTGRAYRPTPVNLEFIMGRMKEGYTAGQCRQVIARKFRDWNEDPRMAPYLRPATLFNRQKFAQYVGELVAPQVHDDRRGGIFSAVS